MDDAAVRKRFYRPRPEWVWDPDGNPRLEARVDLRVRLCGAVAGAAVQKWLTGIDARRISENVYVQGGGAIEIEDSSPEQSTLLLSSGGQDALESLDELVLTLHERILVLYPGLQVAWEELPLSNP